MNYKQREPRADIAVFIFLKTWNKQTKCTYFSSCNAAIFWKPSSLAACTLRTNSRSFSTESAFCRSRVVLSISLSECNPVIICLKKLLFYNLNYAADSEKIELTPMYPNQAASNTLGHSFFQIQYRLALFHITQLRGNIQIYLLPKNKISQILEKYRSGNVQEIFSNQADISSHLGITLLTHPQNYYIYLYEHRAKSKGNILIIR